MGSNSLNWTYLYDADEFLQFRVLIRVLELISVPNHSRDSFILIKFNPLSSYPEIVSVHWRQWCNSLNWTYLYDADGFLQFRVLIRVLELISVPNHSRDSFILIKFNPLSSCQEIVSVHWNLGSNSLNWTYLYDAQEFLQFRVLIRVLELISEPNHSRDSFILIKFNPLSSYPEIVSVHWRQWCNSLNWTYLYDADGFLQFRVLIRVLELISVPNHSRDSFILIQFNPLSSCPEIVSVHWNMGSNSLNWTYLYDADGFLQFRVLIRGLDLISVPNHSRDSFILLKFNPLSSIPEIVSVHWSQSCNSLNWTYLYDADGFLQFRVLIRVLELISVPNHSRDSFILIQFNPLSSSPEIVSVHWNMGSNSLNWTYLYDADEFLQFRVLIRVLELISVPNHSRDSFILIQFNPLSSCPEIVSVHWNMGSNSLNWTYLYDADEFLQFRVLIRVLELISVPNHSRDSFILIKFNPLSSYPEIVSVHWRQWCNSLNWTYLYDADGFLQFRVLIRVLELISVPNHSRDSFILIKFNPLSSCQEIVSVHWNLGSNSLNWTYLYDAQEFLQFRVLIRVLELISEPNHSRDSFILIKFNPLSSYPEIVSVHWRQWCNSLNWTYLYDADGFLQFRVLIRVLELISVPNHSRDSFILIQFNPLSSCPEIVSVHWNMGSNSLNWTYLYDADGFLQFRVLIRGLDLISVPNHSRDSFILLKFNPLSSIPEIVSVHWSQSCNSLNWTYLYDADGFLQFRVLIRVLELISVPNHSRDSFILIQFNPLSSSPEIVSVHWNMGSNSLNWTYLYDADEFLQFRVLIRVLELISVPNHSRDSFILIQFNPLSSCPEIVSVHWNMGSNSLNWTYLYDADEFLQFRVLIRVLELISVPNHSRDSFILIKFNPLSSYPEIVSVHWRQWCNSLNWTYLYDADGFLQFRVLIRVLELISVPNHSRDSFILIKFNPLSSCQEIVSVHWNLGSNSLNWTYLYDAQEFLQFRVLIRVLELISEPNHSRDSFILIKFNPLSSYPEIVSVHWRQWCNSLNWTYLYDADGFLQFRVLIRVLELISVPNHSRDSFILIQFNPLSSCPEIVSVHWNMGSNSLNWTYLYDADGFLQFRVLIRGLDLISVPNHSRDSFILLKFNPLSSIPEIVSVHWSQSCNSLNWTYLYDADGFLQFRVLIRVLELISVPNHSRDSFILIKFNPLSSCQEIVSVHWNLGSNSLNWTYLYDAQEFLQFRVLIRVLELISEPNHSRDSFILIKFNPLSSYPEIVSVHWRQWCNSLNWTYLYDADGFLQFRVLIRVLELISVPNHSRDSFILIQFNPLSSCPEIVSVHWNMGSNSLNWTYLYDADGFLQFRVLIRGLDLISVPNHSRDSFILLKFNPLSSIPEIVSVHWSQSCNSLNWTYLYDADGFLQFRVLIRVLELISVPNHSRDSFILIQFNPLSSSPEIVSVHWNMGSNSLNWTYLYDADEFLQFRVLIRVLELISVPNHSRDSFILIQFNPLSSCPEIVSVHWNMGSNSLNWTYLYDADEFHQFRVLIRVLELISVPNHSRDSFILIKFNPLSSYPEIVSVHWRQWCNSLNWTYLYDADGFLQFRVLIRVLELISVPNHSRDSFILIKFNPLSSCQEIVSVHWNLGSNSLNWTYLYDAQEFLQFRVLIRVLELISEPNHSRDSFILIKFNPLSSYPEIVSVHWRQWCNSLNWTYLYDADGFLQFRVLIRVLELISVPNHSRDSFILLKFNPLSSYPEIVSVHWSQSCNSLNWTYLYDADGFLQFRVLIRVLELISVPNHSRDSFILIQFNPLSSRRRLLVSIGIWGLIHLIGHIFMMQMNSFNFGF